MKKLLLMSAILVLAACGEKPAADAPPAETTPATPERVHDLPRTQWPTLKVRADGPPQTRSWEHRHPEAWARWQLARPATTELAAHLELPPENLVQPEVLRRLVWDPPTPATPEQVAEAMVALGARPWQAGLLSELLAGLLGP